MGKTTILVVIAVFALAMTASAAEWTGHISDAKCGAAHNNHTEASINCVKTCVKAGQAPVFVTAEGQVVKIANPDKVMPHLGHQVKVTGALADGTLTIDTVQHIAP